MFINIIIHCLTNFLQKTVASEFMTVIHRNYLYIIEIFKVEVKLTPEIMNEVFDIKQCSDPFRNKLRFKSQNIHNIKYVIKPAVFVGLRIRSYMSCELKESKSLNKFRLKLNKTRKLPAQTL